MKFTGTTVPFGFVSIAFTILEIYALLINLNERVKFIVNESCLCLCNHCGVSESIIFCQIVYQLTAESEVRRAEELVGLYKSRFEGWNGWEIRWIGNQ